MFKKDIVKEKQFLIDILVKNGHRRTFLKNVVKNHNAKEKNNDSRNYTKSKKILWVPNIESKISKEFKKLNKGITFTFDKNLQSILCQNQPKLVPNNHPGVYQLDCNGMKIKEKSIDTLH